MIGVPTPVHVARLPEAGLRLHLSQVPPFPASAGSPCEEGRRSNLVRCVGLRLLRYARNDTAASLWSRAQPR